MKRLFYLIALLLIGLMVFTVSCSDDDDDDPTNPEGLTIGFSSSSSSGAEDATAITIEIELSEVGVEDVTVEFTIDGSATSAEDYTADTVSPVTIAAGQGSQLYRDRRSGWRRR